MKFWNFSVNAVTKETTSKHKSTKLSMSHVKTHSTANTRNPATTQYLSPPTIISLKRYYPILTSSDLCKNAFKDPPLLAYGCPRNFRDTLVRAEVKTPKTSPSSPPKITSRTHLAETVHVIWAATLLSP